MKILNNKIYIWIFVFAIIWVFIYLLINKNNYKIEEIVIKQFCLILISAPILKLYQKGIEGKYKIIILIL